MKTNNEHSDKIKVPLPDNYIELIRRELIKQGTSLPARWILNIMEGKVGDYYGVIEIASKIANEHKEAKKDTETGE